MKKLLLTLSLLLFLVYCLIWLTGCIFTKPYMVNRDVKAVKVYKGDIITIPYDGYLLSDYTVYRLLLEDERRK